VLPAISQVSFIKDGTKYTGYTEMEEREIAKLLLQGEMCDSLRKIDKLAIARQDTTISELVVEVENGKAIIKANEINNQKCADELIKSEDSNIAKDKEIDKLKRGKKTWQVISGTLTTAVGLLILIVLI